MMSFKMGLFLLFLTGCVSAVDFPRQPANYITKQNIILGPRTTKYFLARLCGGCLYDKFNATVTFNFPKSYWNSSNGNYLRAYVSSANGKVIATNVVSINPSKQLPVFTFGYLKSYGDLHFKITTGPATSFAYTVTLSFAPPPKQSAKNERDCTPRWKVSPEENAQHKELARAVKLATMEDVEDFIPVFQLQKAGVVETNSMVGYQLDYCFPDDLPYNITVSVIGTDDQAGFSTFVCPRSHSPCTVESPYFDYSGAGVNFVTAQIASDADIGPIEVLINGDGRFKENNNFVLGASSYYKT